MHKKRRYVIFEQQQKGYYITRRQALNLQIFLHNKNGSMTIIVWIPRDDTPFQIFLLLKNNFNGQKSNFKYHSITSE